MNVRFVEEAQREFLTAIDYYESATTGLGRRFKEEVDRSILRIASQPDLYRLRPGGYRRVNLRAFPYYIAYFTHAEVLWVLAVAHGHQQPTYWISRRTGFSGGESLEPED